MRRCRRGIRTILFRWSSFGQHSLRRCDRHKAMRWPLMRFGEAIFAALDPKPEHFMKEPVASGPGFASARNVMMQVLHYLAVEDLARAWRVAQPNLEQSGLFKIEYAGLDELVANEVLWSHPTIGSVTPPTRKAVLTAILDHMRS